MKAVCVGIYDRGSIEKERVHFRVLDNIDLVFFAVYDTKSVGVDRVEAGHKSCFWFSSKQIKAGENIVLYTRVGNPSSENRAECSVFHFFFRSLVQPIYTNQETRAVLFEINNYATLV